MPHKTLYNGQFYGAHHKKIELTDLTLTSTTYTHAKVDWHQHENPYFTFLLTGKMLEVSHRQRHYCTAGSLLFHHSEDAHYNTKPQDFTQGFHIELRPGWSTRLELPFTAGSFAIQDPRKQLMAFEIFREFQQFDGKSPLAIETLVCALTQEEASRKNSAPPAWVNTLRELLHDEAHHDLTLDGISQSIGVHPNYLSRAFPVHFGCTLGKYLRTIKLNRALSLMSDTGNSLTEIAYLAGFSDQSHFTRTFRKRYKMTPLAFRKNLRGATG